CSCAITPPIYPLSLHDALPIYNAFSGLNFIVKLRKSFSKMRISLGTGKGDAFLTACNTELSNNALPLLFNSCTLTTSPVGTSRIDRKSTPLHSSHVKISYAVLC